MDVIFAHHHVPVGPGEIEAIGAQRLAILGLAYFELGNALDNGFEMLRFVGSVHHQKNGRIALRLERAEEVDQRRDRSRASSNGEST